jgi:nucleoside-diphosphate-sugar epimerase
MKRIVIAGATGNIGSKTVKNLLTKEVQIHALVRNQTDKNKKDNLSNAGVTIHELDMQNLTAVANACAGADCVLSMLSGLQDVIIDAQKVLLDGAVAAGVPRFIPSDFSIDFRNLVLGKNRNLDLRKRFYEYVNRQPIKATSIFNGALMDLLKTDMPLILTKYKRILCWGDINQKMEFTHSDDIAAFTANVCLDDNSPRHLFIAGDVLSCNDFTEIMTEITGEEYKILKPGGIGLLNTLISATKFFSPGKEKVYPAWQGMQYMRDMMEGRIDLQPVYANQRYNGGKFISVKEFLN